MPTSEIQQTLRRWRDSLCAEVSVGSLLSRNPIAYKWKAPYRSLVLRETVFWRTHDLLTQAQLLHEAKHTLGSRILIRSALESVAVLIHLNQLTARVLDGLPNFHEFDDRTRKLLLGSRNRSTSHDSINVVTVLQHCERKYQGLMNVYETLSECAHPNFEGVCFGYSDVDQERHETRFSNKWQAMWADRHEKLVKLVFAVLEAEYNDVWAPHMKELEAWLVRNDAVLEATKGSDI
jgi:hypothetical protein